MINETILKVFYIIVGIVIAVAYFAVIYPHISDIDKAFVELQNKEDIIYREFEKQEIYEVSGLNVLGQIQNVDTLGIEIVVNNVSFQTYDNVRDFSYVVDTDSNYNQEFIISEKGEITKVIYTN